MSNEGALIFGAEIESTLFYDLVKYNRKFFKGDKSDILILGYDEVFYLIYDNNKKDYAIIDRETWEPDFSSRDLFEPLTFLLRL
ncbi:MAG: hypothetical protein LBR70_02685 [Lactobacillaceae bacterium]|nr:hypothetical protein [Lactobacillaceae bacterium]